MPLDWGGALLGSYHLSCAQLNPSRAPDGVVGWAKSYLYTCIYLNNCVLTICCQESFYKLWNGDQQCHPRVHFAVMMDFPPALAVDFSLPLGDLWADPSLWPVAELTVIKQQAHCLSIFLFHWAVSPLWCSFTDWASPLCLTHHFPPCCEWKGGGNGWAVRETGALRPCILLPSSRPSSPAGQSDSLGVGNEHISAFPVGPKDRRGFTLFTGF